MFSDEDELDDLTSSEDEALAAVTTQKLKPQPNGKEIAKPVDDYKVTQSFEPSRQCSYTAKSLYGKRSLHKSSTLESQPL